MCADFKLGLHRTKLGIIIMFIIKANTKPVIDPKNFKRHSYPDKMC